MKGMYKLIKKDIALILLVSIGIMAGCAATNITAVPAEPTVEYFKLDSGKLKPGKLKVNAFYEIKKDDRIYVFISPKAKAEFEKSGNTGKDAVTGIGFGPNGETVVFESGFAQKEYEARHSVNQ
jgi:hypothetical protein